jgi:hypothetical protein
MAESAQLALAANILAAVDSELAAEAAEQSADEYLVAERQTADAELMEAEVERSEAGVCAVGEDVQFPVSLIAEVVELLVEMEAIFYSSWEGQEGVIIL